MVAEFADASGSMRSTYRAIAWPTSWLPTSVAKGSAADEITRDQVRDDNAAELWSAVVRSEKVRNTRRRLQELVERCLRRAEIVLYRPDRASRTR